MIESINNERVIKYAKLNGKKYREEYNLFIVEGEHLVEEALKNNLVKEILLLNGEENKFGSVTYVTSDILKKITSLTNPPKVLAICHMLNKTNVEGNIIILDDISDPGNLGTIIRSAVAFNYKTIILSPRSVDIYNPKVIRASEGMLFNINFLIADLPAIINELKMNKYLVLGTDVKTGKHPQAQKSKHAIVIGSEAKGIKSEVLDLCDQKLLIKMNPLCESLNAGVSASILMYELNKVL